MSRRYYEKMPAWLIWVILAAGLGIAEIFTLTFVLGLMATAALVAALLGVLGLPVFVQVLGFAVVTGAGLVFVRPIMQRHLHTSPESRDGVAGLVGKSALVLEPVDADRGLIKLAGEEWSARSLLEDVVIPAGTHVDVTQIDGATAVVYPREALPEVTEENDRPTQT